MRTNIDLAGAWTGRADPDGPTDLPPQAALIAGRTFDAVVPGAIHADLQAAGLIPDPLIDENELAVAWVGRTDWQLARRLPAIPAAERVDIVFDGIDTVAEAIFNGTPIGWSRNMHRSYRYDVTSLLQAENTLAVRFTSAYTEAEAQEKRLGARPNAYPQPFNFIRKMACSFGWDWGPTLVSAGLWRGVRVEAWDVARISSLRPLADIDAGAGVLTAHVEVERAASGQDRALTLNVSIGGHTTSLEIPAGSDSATAVLTIPDVELWQPRGHGAQSRYSVEVELSSAGETLDKITTAVGFRTVVVNREADEIGSSFVFEVNGQPLFIKGVNWIPESIYPGTLTQERYRARLQQAVDANVNLIRVWGGGIYESDDFYDLCDELGLLVWQDFLFACASYPEDEPLRSEVIAEARENVARLSSHPSLTLWCGNNENLWMHDLFDWPTAPGGDLSWGEGYYLDILPRIVAELDPARPYTEGSPWSGPGLHPGDPNHQTFHSWTVWNDIDYAHYRDSAPRFVSEFGWQGAPAWRTLRDAVTDEAMALDSPRIRHHQKAIDGHAKLARGLRDHFRPTSDFDKWHFQTQWTQVDAVRTGVLHWRSHWPRTAGTILWQLNDLWPVTSWAVIDGAGRPKPLYFALRDMYNDRVASIEPGPDGLEFCAINNSDNEWHGEAVFRRLRHDGTLVEHAHARVEASAQSVARIPVPASIATAPDDREHLVVVDFGDKRALWFPSAPRDTDLRETAPSMTVEVVAGGLDITVVAKTLVRDVLVQPDRIHPAATVDRGFTTLLPGESATFRVRADAELRAEWADAKFAVSSLREAV